MNNILRKDILHVKYFLFVKYFMRKMDLKFIFFFLKLIQYKKYRSSWAPG
jgi:hypothetical protein